MKNREIKFRAWNGKKMNYEPLVSTYDTSVNSEFYFAYSGQSNLEFMQYTGLKDKNGKEIYEGDLLNVGENLLCEIIYIDVNNEDYGDEIHCSFHAKVYKHNKIIPIDSYFKNNCKIIGNIYENPELL